MELHYTPTSPYARKVRIMLRERGLADAIREDVTSPFESESIRAANPLGKVPALVTPDGLIFDSPVILDYLDLKGTGPALQPAAPEERLIHSRWQALADGILDSAVAWRFELAFHEEGARSQMLMGRYRAAIVTGLDHAEKMLPTLPAGFGVPQIALGAVFGYLDFRFADLGLPHWMKG
jgi:glutathione S-transferase